MNFYTTGSDIYGGYDTYTVSFDFLNANCWTNSNSNTAEIVLYGEGASFPSPLYSTYISANSTKRNAVLYLSRTGGWVNSFNPNGDTETTIGNFSGNAWYTASITVTRSTGKVSYLITPKGSSTPVTNGSGNFIASSGETSFNCQGIFLTFGAGYAVKIANVKVTTEVVYATSSATLEGYKTFYNATTNYQVDENTTIYKAAAPSEGKVVLTDVGGNKIIKAGEAVILKTTNTSDYTITLSATKTVSTGDFDGNALQVADGTESNKYVLGYTAAKGFGFYYYTESLPAGYIYLDGTAPGVKMLNVIVDGTATGVEAPVAAEVEEDGVYYNLNGQVVTKDYKGIVIKNGKKYLNK